MKKHLESLFQATLYYSGLLRILRSLKPQKVNIITYHWVGDVFGAPYESLRGISVSLGAFKKQMLYFKENYDILKLTDLVAAIEENRSINRSLVITLDDGYACLRDVFPFLVEHKIPATVFVNTDLLDCEHLSWQNKLDLLIHADAGYIVSDEIRQSLGIEIDITTGRLSSEWYSPLYSRQLASVVEKVFPRVFSDEYQAAQDAQLYLNWADLEYWQGDLIQFSNHTQSHYNIMSLGREELIQEVKIGQELLYQHGITHPVFCIPFGGYGQSYDERVLNILKDECGYGYVLSLDDGTMDGKRLEPLLNRTSITRSCDRTYKFACAAEHFSLRATKAVLTGYHRRLPHGRYDQIVSDWQS